MCQTNLTSLNAFSSSRLRPEVEALSESSDRTARISWPVNALAASASFPNTSGLLNRPYRKPGTTSIFRSDPSSRPRTHCASFSRGRRSIGIIGAACAAISCQLTLFPAFSAGAVFGSGTGGTGAGAGGR